MSFQLETNLSGLPRTAGVAACKRKAKTLTTGKVVRISIRQMGSLSWGQREDSHPACRNNAGARKAFRLLSAALRFVVLAATSAQLSSA